MCKPHFSIRTIAIVISVFALYLAALSEFTPHQGRIPVGLLFAYIAFWIAPAASLGYDRRSSWSGVVNGLIWGAWLCAITFWLFGFILLRSYSISS